MNFFFFPVHKRFITFHTEGKLIEVGTQIQRPDHLADLLANRIGLYQESPHLSDRYYPAMQYAPVFRQNNSSLIECYSDEIIIINPIYKKRIESQHPQPFGQFAHIGIRNKY